MVWNNKEHCTAEQILLLKQELAALEARREEILKTIAHLETLQQTNLQTTQIESSGINAHSSENQKVALFRSLFRGREDVFPKRFESKRTGRQRKTLETGNMLTLGDFFTK